MSDSREDSRELREFSKQGRQAGSQPRQPTEPDGAGLRYCILTVTIQSQEFSAAHSMNDQRGKKKFEQSKHLHAPSGDRTQDLSISVICVD